MLQMTLLPASSVHYKGTINHGGDPWRVPSALGPVWGGNPAAHTRARTPVPVPVVGNRNEGERPDWIRQRCTCGAQDTFGIQFQKLSLNCGYILKAHEDVALAELQKRVKIVSL